MTSSPRGEDDAVIGAITGESEEFKQAILAKYKSVCQIHASSPYAYDWTRVSSNTATAFYVDAEHGFVLTNRHVTSAGPFWGNLVFGSNVEFGLTVRYTDPEVDFSILQIDDVEKVRSLGIEEIKLAPEKAKPGVELRLLSNEVGTKLSMARAVLSRIDVAPPYGRDADSLKIINTPCYLASLSAVGGSSGGPALNDEGEAVALQVGGITKTSVNYLLPLHYPQLALQRLRAGLPVTRGTIQVNWDLKPLHECRRFKLPTEWEDKIREVGVNYAIVADTVLEGGPAYGKLQVGDILLELDNSLCTDLFKLSRYMDEHVNKTVSVLLWRDSETIKAECTVEDLHAIIPHHLISRFGVSFHALSWQVAIGYEAPVEGIFVAGYSMSSAFSNGMLIDSINDMPTRTMDQLIAALEKLGSGHCYITTVQKRLDDRQTPIVTTCYLPVDYSGRSVEMKRSPREGGGWELVKTWDPPRHDPTEAELSKALEELSLKSILPKNEYPKAVNDIFHSVFKIEWYNFACMEDKMEGLGSSWGIVFDTELGLGVVPRYDGSLFSEVSVNFADCVDVDGHIVFLHPLANVMSVQYDTKRLPKGLDIVACRLCDRDVRVGDDVYYVALGGTENKVVFTKVESLSQHTIDDRGVPGYKPAFHETIALQHKSIDTRSSGVLLLEDGSVAGLKVPWQYTIKEDGESTTRITDCFISASRLEEIISLEKKGQLETVRWQDFDISKIPLADAVRRGMSRQRLSAVNAHPSAKSQVLVVDKVPSNSWSEGNEKNAHPLQTGDIILEIDGNPVVESKDVKYVLTQPSLSVHVLRSKKELQLEIPTISSEQLQVEEVLQFCGASFHRPTLSLRARFHPCYSEVYMCFYLYGSPAEIYGLPTQSFVTKVNGQEVVTMEDFKRAIGTIPDQTYFTMILWQHNLEKLVSVKLNTTHWPSFSLSRDKPIEKGTWTRTYVRNQTELAVK